MLARLRAVLGSVCSKMPSRGNSAHKDDRPLVLCSGVACVDMELSGCQVPTSIESVTPYQRTEYRAGGSAPQTARAFVALGQDGVHAVYPAYPDAHGEALHRMLSDAGVIVHAIVPSVSTPTSGECKPGDTAKADSVCDDRDGTRQDNTDTSCTALAVLPLLQDGRRACFVSLGACLQASTFDMFPPETDMLHAGLEVFHFGYPHLLPHMQGQALRDLLVRVRENCPQCIISVDVNGADAAKAENGASSSDVLLPALSVCDVVHANLDEAFAILPASCAGKVTRKTTSAPSADELSAAEAAAVALWFVDNEHGAWVSCVTAGRDGVFVASRQSKNAEAATTVGVEPARVIFHDAMETGDGHDHRGATNAAVHVRAIAVTDGVTVNASGAGDAFCAGAVACVARLFKGGRLCRRQRPCSGAPRAMLEVESVDDTYDVLSRIGTAGVASALHRLDPVSADCGPVGIEELIERTAARERIASRWEQVAATAHR